jgi:hypothetical protein
MSMLTDADEDESDEGDEDDLDEDAFDEDSEEEEGGGRGFWFWDQMGGQI